MQHDPPAATENVVCLAEGAVIFNGERQGAPERGLGDSSNVMICSRLLKAWERSQSLCDSFKSSWLTQVLESV